MNAEKSTSLLAQWNGLIDPWQQSPEYVPWTSSSTSSKPEKGGVRPMFCAAGMSCAGGTPPPTGGGSSGPLGGGGAGGDSVGGGGGGPIGWTPNGCAALTAPAAGSTNIAASGQPAETLNDLIMNNAALNNLGTYLYDNEALPSTVNISNSSSDGTAAEINSNLSNPAASSLDWYTQTLYADGFDPTQVLYQEFDHQYWTIFGQPPNPNTNPPQVASVVFAGQTYYYNITPTQNPDGSWNMTGYTGYQHFQIYQDIQSNFGIDKSGALNEALQAANNAPTGTALSTALSHNGQAVTSFSAGDNKMPTAGNTCGGQVASTGRNTMSVQRGLSSVTFVLKP